MASEPTGVSEAIRRRLADVGLYVITPAEAEPERVLRTALGACRGGADVLQLRRKVGGDADLLALAKRCREITAAAGVVFVVNDRLDIALAVGADGVHLGQGDLPLEAARRVWPGGLIGRSTHDIAQAVAAQASGADYLGVGPVFATPTKPGRPPTGVELVARAAARLSIPWVAIGGIDAGNVAAVVGAGARAIAVVRAIGEAADPEAATARLRTAVDDAVARGRSRAATGPAARTWSSAQELAP